MFNLKKFIFALVVLSFIVGPNLTKAAIFSSTNTQTEQFYSVIFNRQGDADVLARSTFFNPTKDDMSKLEIVVPGAQVRVLNLVQQKPETTKNCTSYDFKVLTPQNQTPPCLIWQDYPTGRSLYSALDFTQTDNNDSLKLNFDLKESIKPQQATTVLLHYKASGLALKNWHSFSYNFQTVKSNFDIDSVRVSIDVNDDLFIKKDATGSTNSVAQPEIVPMATSASFSASPNLDTVSSSVSTATGVVKSTTSLNPNENFSVKGKYYENSFYANLTSSIVLGLTFLIIIILLGFIIKKENRK